MERGFLEDKVFDKRGGYFLQISGQVYLADVPANYLIKGVEVFYHFYPKKDRNGWKGILVDHADFSGVVDQICKKEGLSPSQIQTVSNSYGVASNAGEFEQLLKSDVSYKTLKSLKRKLYGFNFLLKKTREYFPCGLDYDAGEELFEKFGFKAFNAFEADPYKCIGERVTFKMADKYFFYSQGFFGGTERYGKIVDYLLTSVQNEGSTVISPQSVGNAARRCGLPSDDIEALAESVANKAKALGLTELLPKLVIKERYNEEKELAAQIHSLKKSEFVSDDKIAQFKEIIKSEGINLTLGQANALDAARFRGRTCCITGGPGTGKTTCLKTLIRLMRWAVPNLFVKTVAPTGKAAKRLAESSGEETSTIHRLLEPRMTKGENGNFFSFARNEKNKIEADVVIVDESSMMDTNLATALYKAIKPETLLLLVGDVDQLPSVQAGQVFHDIIVSGKIPVYRLTKTMRQAEGSTLLNNIHAFRDKKVEWEQGSDFITREVDNPQSAYSMILAGAEAEYTERGLFNFQVLVPQHYALCGTEHLNVAIQRRVNPNFQVDSNDKFFIGDKVILLKNNTRRGYLNGDVGCVIKKSAEGFTVRLVDGNEIFVEDEKDMDLAYAVTVHKAQGSEYACCIIACLWESVSMLTQNWVYTAVSRAKELCCVVIEKGVFGQIGIGSERSTCLNELL